MNEGSGLTAHDTSGYGNNGALLPIGSEPTWINGKYGKALSFNGNNYADIAQNQSLNANSITFSAWINPSNVSDTQNIISGKWNDLTQFFIYNGKLRVIARPTLTTLDFTSNTPLSPNVWYFVTFTYDSSTGIGTIYVNGVPDGTGTGEGNIGALSGVVRIGAQSKPLAQAFKGIIDEVRMYNRQLNQIEITQLYNAAG